MKFLGIVMESLVNLWNRLLYLEIEQAAFFVVHVAEVRQMKHHPSVNHW